MELKERLGVSIIGPHEADKFILDNIETSAASYGAGGVMHNCTPDQFLIEGDKVSLAVMSLKFSLPRSFAGACCLFTIARHNSPMSAMCCSTVRSAARISRVAIMPR